MCTNLKPSNKKKNKISNQQPQSLLAIDYAALVYRTVWNIATYNKTQHS